MKNENPAISDEKIVQQTLHSLMMMVCIALHGYVSIYVLHCIVYMGAFIKDATTSARVFNIQASLKRPGN